jgi:hypothetical protein
MTVLAIILGLIIVAGLASFFWSMCKITFRG